MSRRRSILIVRITVFAVFSFFSVFAILRSPLASSGPLKSINALVKGTNGSATSRSGNIRVNARDSRIAGPQVGVNPEMPFDTGGLGRDRGTEATPNSNPEPQAGQSGVVVTPSATFTVTRSDDIAPRGTCAVGDCTLREAVIAANGAAGSTINFAAGLNGVPITLTIAATQAEDLAANGDLDVNASVTITGNGTANTIIQAGVTAFGGVDKIFGLNPNCTTAAASAISVTITDLTIRNGHNTDTVSAQFSQTGGAIDFCGGGNGATTSTLTMTNVIVRDSQVDNGTGGGLNISGVGQGTTNINLTNVQFLNNRTVDSVHPSTGAGASITLNTSAASMTVNMTNCTFDSNQAQNSNGGGLEIISNITAANTGIFNIHNTVFSNNQAKGLGGGIDVSSTSGVNGKIALTIDQQSVIKNNVSGAFSGTAAGGGIHVETPNASAVVSLSKVTITGNSNSAGAVTQLGGGGVAVGTIDGSFNMAFSRLANNTVSGAGVGSGFRKDNQAGTATVTNNWWGCSDGPSAAPCDTAVLVAGSGALNFTPFLRLHTTASPNPIPLGSTSALLTRVQDSTGTDTAVANLDVFVNTNATAGSPLPVAWGAATNTVTPINTTLISSGGFAQATATYNGTTKVHLDQTRAKVDNDFTTGAHTNVVGITVLAPPSIAKAFGAANIPINGTTTLLFTLTNSNVGDALNGLAFSDTFPANIVVAAAPGVVNNCGGTFTAVAGAGSVSLSGGTIGINTTCTVQVNVRGTVDGTANNTSGNVTATDAGGLTGNTASASTLVANPPTITKGFGAATIPLNVNAATTLTFNLSNTNTVTTLNGIVFTDTLPAGLVVATPNGLTNTCSGAVTATAGSGSVSLASSTLAAAGTCAISVNVTGTTAGVKNNSVTATSTTTGVLNSTSNASVTVVAPPTISKAFGAASIPLNGSTSLTFTINNPNATVVLNGVAFSDTLPAGLVISTPNGLSNTCGGTVTAVAGSGSVSLSGGTVAVSSSCTISINVDGTTNGTKSNTTGAISSTEGGTGTTSNTANLNVFAPPSIAKAFGAATIPVGGSTSLTFTITNPVGNPGVLTGLGFTDTLPAGLVVATPNGLSNTCGGAVTAVAASGSVSLSAGTSAAAGLTCTVQVNVTGTTSGIKNNTSGAVSSTNGGTGNTASASLTVASPPTISKAFGAATIPLNGSTSLTITITNPNTIGLTGLAFSDSLPAGLVVATPNGLVNTCNGTPSAVAGSGTVSLSAGTVGASTTCTVTVNVTGTTAGIKSNTTGVVSSTESGPGVTSNTANITVVPPPTISKAFGAASIPLNGTTSLTFTINNPSATVTQTGIAFSDTLPAGLVVATPNGLSTNGNCGGGAVITAVAGSGSISLSTGTVTTGAPTCTITVNVTGTTNGDKLNTTGTISSTEGGTGATSNTATLTVVAPPTFSKAFGVAQISLNGTTSLTFTIVNPAGNTVALTGVAFTDNLPAGLVVATPNGLANNGNCGAPTVTATAASSSVTVSGGTVNAGLTCTITVNVTGTTSGVKNNTTGTISSTNGGTGTTANASLTVASAPVISKSFTPSTIGVGSTSTSTLSFTITNSNTSSLTGVGFTDNFPAGLQVFNPNGLSGSCGGGTITATANSTSVSLTGATLGASSSCTFSVLVTATTTGVKTNTTSAVTSTEAGNGNTATATLTVLANPTIAKSFASASINVGDTVALTFSITNPNAGSSLTGVHFSDPLPSGLHVSNPNGLVGSCGGGTITAVPNSTSIILSGATLPASGSCSFSVNVTAISSGTQANVTGNVTSTNGGTGNSASASIDTCTYNVTPTSFSFPIAGGTGNITVTPNPATCTWSAAANDPFIHVTSGAGPTTGNGTVQFSVDPSGGTARTGSLTVATQVVTIDQTNPTDIRLSSFDAYGAGSNTILTWDTGLEINNLGFNVYRQVGSERVKVNPSLIAGSALMVGGNVNLQAGLSYTWKDETYDGSAGYWLEEIDLSGNSTWHGPIGVKASGLNNISRSRSVLLSELNSSARSGENSVIQRGYPAGFSPDQNVIGPVSSVTSGRSVTTNRPTIRTGQTSASLKNQWAIAAKSGVKLGVNKTGWYHVNVADMIAAGFDSNVNPASLQMFVNGSEIPIKVNSGNPAVLSPNDSVEFFGTGLDMPTSNTQVYFLVAGSGTGKRISSQQATAAGNNGGATSFDYTVERKDRTLYFSSLLNGDAENFFGQLISGNVSQKLTVHHLDQNASGQAEIEIALQGVNLVQHSVGVSINGTPIQNISFNAMDHPVVRISVPQSALVEGDNTIAFGGGSGDFSLVDYVKITYAHTYAAENNSLFATANGLLPVKIGGFSSNLIRAFDVTNSSQPTELLGTIDGAGNDFTITVNGAKRRDLLAFTPDQMLQPLSITVNHPSTLNQGGNADFLMITSKEFQSSLEPLRALRQSQGYKVAVIDVEDIYDEFNYGVHSPYAIREFLNWTYLHWAQQPQYVMLAGSASLDPRNYEGLGNLDFVPTKLIDAGTLETASDDWFVDFNDDGLPKMAIGRLPVRTAGEATQLVNKIIAYDQSTATSRTVVLVSDLNDSGIDFTAANNAILSLIPSQFNVVNILRDQATVATKAALMDQLKQGNRIVNYAGHGSVNQWRAGMLDDDDMNSLADTNVSPLVVSMTCLTGYFQDPRLASLGESLIKVNKGGAVSAWASSGMTSVSGQTTMNQAFFKQLMGNTSITIGQAIKAAKSTDIDKDVRRTWILFGDPTMRIK